MISGELRRSAYMFEAIRQANLFTYQEKIQQLKAEATGRLFSVTNEIEKVDPLAFFSAYEAIEEDRWFWTSADQQTFFVGIGSAIQFESEKADLQFIQNEWNDILQHAEIDNPYENIGTGPVIYGGEPFDYKKATTSLWKHFETSRFILPKYMLVVDKDQCFMTYNLFVKATTASEQFTDDWEKLEMGLKEKPIYEEIVTKAIRAEEIEPEDWKDTIQLATDTIARGEAHKIVLAREIRVTLSASAHIGALLHELLQTQPNSYVFAFSHQGDSFIGASPERLVRVYDDEVLSTCLAGTAPRGKHPIEDETLSRDLLNDPKNRSEHHFVVDMIRKAVQPFCDELNIPEKPTVTQLKNLQHLYTPVEATLKPSAHLFNLVQALHPTPALGGTPKEASLAFIREHELLDRGWYGAPIGWLDAQQNGEFAVAIRSGLIQKDEASLFAGCGVVEDSDPEMEYAETKMKFRPMLSILEDE